MFRPTCFVNDIAINSASRHRRLMYHRFRLSSSQAGSAGLRLVPSDYPAEVAGAEAVHPAGLVHLHDRHL